MLRLIQIAVAVFVGSLLWTPLSNAVDTMSTLSSTFAVANGSSDGSEWAK